MGLLAPGQGVAQSLARSSGLYVQEIQLAQEKNQRTLSLHFSRPPDSVRAFTLRSPARLVIDVRGEVKRSASATHPTSDALITRVRVGSHPHHTRFVLDLKAEQLPPFSVEQQARVVTATLDERDEVDNSNANAEQGNTQVLFARAPKASSQSIPPRPAQAPASSAPTVLAKKVPKKVSLPPLHRATPPASTPRVKPDREVPLRTTPLPSAVKERKEATPIKAPPTSAPPLPMPAPVNPSPDTPQPLPASPAPTVLAKKEMKKSPPPLPQATPLVPTPREAPAREGPAPATPLLSAAKERKEAAPFKAPPPSVPESLALAPTISPKDTPQPPLVSSVPRVLAKKVERKAPPLRRAAPPVPTPRRTPDKEGPVPAIPLSSATEERKETAPLKATPVPRPPVLMPAISPKDTPQSPPVSPAPRVLAKKVTKEAPPLPLRRATPPASTPRETPAREAPAQGPPLPSAPQGLRAAIPLKDTPPAASRLPAPAPRISPPDTPQPPPASATAAQHLRQGYTLYNQGNIDGAIRQWRQAIDQAPGHAEAHYRIGIALQERGELPQAITALREATRLNPDEATIHIHLARACEAAGNTQDALAAYRKALQLVPTSAHVHHRIGHVLAAQGDLAGAMQAWRQTIHLQPDYAYAYVSLGRALGQSGQKNEAVAVYEQALQLDPRAPFVAEVRQQIARLRAAEP